MITKKFLTQNDTFVHPTLITPRYLIVHSTAQGYPNKDRLFNGWNRSGKLSVHGMVDDTGSWQTLPLNFLGWHVGSRGNSKTVGFEICEPKNIVYANANHTRVDTKLYDPNDPSVRADFEKRYKNAVELAVAFCRETGIPASRVVSHKEGWTLGIASNHGDPDQWWSLFGKTMDGFRAEVAEALKASETPAEKPAEKVLFRVQAGAFLKKGSAERLIVRLENAGFSAIAVHDGLFTRVQAGAFAKYENARALMMRLHDAGFAAIVKNV